MIVINLTNLLSHREQQTTLTTMKKHMHSFVN
jgi:hypothetical protein